MKIRGLICLLLLLSCESPKLHTVCFTGDVLLDRGINRMVKEKGAKYIIDPVSSLLSPYQYRFINLECPLTPNSNPLDKEIVFQGKPQMVSILQKCNITHASLANNHVNDQNTQGLKDTHQILISSGIKSIGANSIERSSCEPIEIVDRGKIIAVFSLLDLQLNPEESRNLCACGATKLAEKIWEYKNRHQEVKVICYIHWGIEYHPYPSVQQEDAAKILINAGADAIVGHHPHVIQKIDYYQNKPIFYSLGNFVFDQSSPEAQLGIIAGFNVQNNTLQATITPYKIRDGRPIGLSLQESNKALEKLTSLSRNVGFRQVQSGWRLVEQKNKNAEKEVQLENNLEFKPHGINDKYFKGWVSLKRLTYLSGYRLSTKSNKDGSDELHIPYPVYRFETGDLNHDGKTDLLLGVIKSTHFEQKVAKRLFALQIDSGQIRPLWLGSKLCQNLVDFKVVEKSSKMSLITIEQANDGSFSNGIYEWDDFGLRLIQYTSEKIDYAKAIQNFEYEDN